MYTIYKPYESGYCGLSMLQKYGVSYTDNQSIKFTVFFCVHQDDGYVLPDSNYDSILILIFLQFKLLFLVFLSYSVNLTHLNPDSS